MNFIAKIASAMILAAGLANASQYTIDQSHTNVGFTVKHMMITNVSGNFDFYDATIDFDAASKTFKTFKATVDTDSINTGIEKRDEHLRSDDFFASAKFPKMIFEMTSYKDGKMQGNLTIRNITKPITLEVEDLGTVKDFKGQNRVGLSLKGKINRMDYDLKWNKALELGGVAVAEDVKINVDIEAVEK